jgi:hypothetical protein
VVLEVSKEGREHGRNNSEQKKEYSDILSSQRGCEGRPGGEDVTKEEREPFNPSDPHLNDLFSDHDLPVDELEAAESSPSTKLLLL